MRKFLITKDINNELNMMKLFSNKFVMFYLTTYPLKDSKKISKKSEKSVVWLMNNIHLIIIFFKLNH